MFKRMSAGDRIFTVANYIVLLAFAVVIVLPIFCMVMNSFVSEAEIARRGAFIFIPEQWDLTSYRTLWSSRQNLIRAYGNTLFRVIVGTSMNLAFTIALAYPLSKRNLKGRTAINALVFFTMIFSGGMVPSFLLIRSLDLMNTRWSVILSCLLSTYYVVLVTNFIRSLPGSLLESARLDGASEATILVRIVLPLSKPILATIALFYAVDKWNEWWNSMLYINRMEMYPLQLILQSIINTYQSATDRNIASADALNRLKTFSMGIKMAAIVVTMLPIMCVFPFLQRFFVKGIMIGAVKG